MLHQIDNIYSTVFVVNVSKNVLLLFVDAFDELIRKIMQLISNICLRYSILYLPLKFHSNVSNDCHYFANLLLEYFNLGHPVDQCDCK